MLNSPITDNLNQLLSFIQNLKRKWMIHSQNFSKFQASTTIILTSWPKVWRFSRNIRRNFKITTSISWRPLTLLLRITRKKLPSVKFTSNLRKKWKILSPIFSKFQKSMTMYTTQETPIRIITVTKLLTS